MLHAAIEAEDRKRTGVDETGKALNEVVKLYTNVVADQEKLISDLKAQLARRQEEVEKLAATVKREEETVREGHLKISTVNSTHDPGPIVQEFQQRAAGSARLLLVEHHPDTANAMKRLLQARGHRVDATSDVIEAREMVRTDPRKRYDVIVTEIVYDAAVAELVRIARQRGTASIALTGHDFPDRRQWATEVGFAAFIGKPATPDEVDAIIQQVLKKELTALSGSLGLTSTISSRGRTSAERGHV